MGFFSELEGNLEKYIEGFFKDKFGSGSLQPVEVAKKLAREMRDRRQAGVQGIYVPNRFEVYLGPQDFDAFKPLVDRLSTEMKQYLIDKADEKKYILPGPVSVIFKVDQRLARGKFKIESFFDSVPEDEDDAGVAPEDTLQYIPVRANMNPLPGRQLVAVLEVAEGSLAGRRFALHELTVIGRGQTCHVYLPEPSISRRHAVITRTGNRYTISDQASTNGTYVNGMRVTRAELADGDIIKLGRAVLTFKVE